MNRSELEEILRDLNDLQVQYVAARMNYTTDRETAESLGINPITVSNWKAAGIPIDDAVRLVRLDGVVVGREMLRRLVGQAVGTVARHMSSRNPRIALDAATQVLDRAGLKEALVVDAGDNLAELLREWRKGNEDGPEHI